MITVYTLLGLTFIIFIHELGHFLAARWCGVKVYTFSIGFGPRVITFYRDKQGTEYVLSLIPLGGFVRMKGQEDLPSQKPEDDLRDDDHFLAKKPWQRLLIILAGVKMNLISAFAFVILAFLIGIPFSSNVIGGFLPDSPALSSSLRIGDEIVEVNGVETDTMEGIITTVALQDSGSPTVIKVLRQEGGSTEEIVTELNLNGDKEGQIPQLGVIPKTEFAVAGLSSESELYRQGLRNGDILEEIILEGRDQGYRGITAWNYIKRNPEERVSIRYRNSEGQVYLLEDIMIGKKTVPEKGFYFSPRIQVIPGYPAEVAGLEDGDVILSINDHTILYWDEILHYLQSGDQGQPVKIEVERDDQVISYSVTPYFDSARGSFILGVTDYIDPNNRGKEISLITPSMERIVPGIRVGDALVNYHESEGQVSVEVIRDGNLISFDYEQAQVGEKTVGYLFDYVLHGKTVRYSLGDALPASFFLIKQEFSEVLSFFSLLIRGQMPLEVMGGPIAIFEVSHQIAETKGWSYFVLLLAKISISLVILNLLPIPVLDGGHACIIIYEMVRRKPVPEKALRFLQAAGIVFLLILIVYVNYNDISRIMNR